MLRSGDVLEVTLVLSEDKNTDPLPSFAPHVPRVLQLKPGAKGGTLGWLLLLAPACPWQLLVSQPWCPRCLLGGHRALSSWVVEP